jgi:phosphomannomutase / phosphoglucomutase
MALDRLFRRNAASETPAAATPTPAKSKGKSSDVGGVGIYHLGATWWLVVLLCILMSGFFAHLSISDLLDERRQREIVLQAERISSGINGAILQLQQQMRHLAATPLARQAAAGDSNAGQQLVDAVMQIIPGVMRITLHPSDRLTPNPSLKPPISFACVDLLRQTQRTHNPSSLEMHRFGSDEAHIDMVVPIRDGDRTLALLLMTLQPTLVNDWLVAAFGASVGYAELRQPEMGIEPLLLAATGNRALRQGSPHLQPLPLGRWQVAWWSAAAGSISDDQRLIVLIQYTLMVLLVSVASLLFIAIFVMLVRRDLNALIGLVADGHEQRHAIHMRLTEFKRAANAVAIIHRRRRRQLSEGDNEQPPTG